jgi:hypothetical protein
VADVPHSSFPTALTDKKLDEMSDKMLYSVTSCSTKKKNQLRLCSKEKIRKEGGGGRGRENLLQMHAVNTYYYYYSLYSMCHTFMCL